MSAGEIRVAIKSDQDIVVARQRGRALAAEAGFSSGDATLIATAISELARNIVSYARKGEITLKIVYASIRQGILIVASDNRTFVRRCETASPHREAWDWGCPECAG